MSKRHPKLLIIDILTCIERIQEYTAGMAFEQFETDSKTQDAVVRNIQVIGEASNRLPLEFRAHHPEVQWNKIIRSRHIVTHDYDSVDYTIIWRIIKDHLPETKSSLEIILKAI